MGFPYLEVVDFTVLSRGRAIAFTFCVASWEHWLATAWGKMAEGLVWSDFFLASQESVCDTFWILHGAISVWTIILFVLNDESLVLCLGQCTKAMRNILGFGTSQQKMSKLGLHDIAWYNKKFESPKKTPAAPLGCWSDPWSFSLCLCCYVNVFSPCASK